MSAATLGLLVAPHWPGSHELGALLVAAGLGLPAEHALISLLALNGLRVSEATGADIEALGIERGHRTLVVTPQGRQDCHPPACPAHQAALSMSLALPGSTWQAR